MKGKRSGREVVVVLWSEGGEQIGSGYFRIGQGAKNRQAVEMLLIGRGESGCMGTS